MYKNGIFKVSGNITHAILGFVLFQISFQSVFPFFHSAVHQTEIIFFDLPYPQFLVEDPQCRGGLGGNDDAAGVAVNAVDQRRGKTLLLVGAVFALFV